MHHQSATSHHQQQQELIQRPGNTCDYNSFVIDGNGSSEMLFQHSSSSSDTTGPTNRNIETPTTPTTPPNSGIRVTGANVSSSPIGCRSVNDSMINLKGLYTAGDDDSDSTRNNSMIDTNLSNYSSSSSYLHRATDSNGFINWNGCLTDSAVAAAFNNGVDDSNCLYLTTGTQGRF